MSPLVSVLIPCFNAERHIGETLNSVLGQTWPNIEVIVVDDGSTDQSLSEVRRFGQRVRLISQQNKGVCSARNAALEAADGEFIQFIDADDLIDADKIALQMNRLVDHPRSVASSEWGRFYREPEETLFGPEANWEDCLPIEWLVRSRAEGRGMMFPAIWLAPRPVLEAAGPWNEALSRSGTDDGEYFTRVVLASDQVLFCKGAHCRYRSGIAGSLSKSRNWSLRFKVIELSEAHVRAVEDSERVRRVFALSWQHLAHASLPYDSITSRRALDRAKRLHSLTIRPRGGPGFRMLSRVIGWRAARRLQVASGRP